MWLIWMVELIKQLHNLSDEQILLGLSFLLHNISQPIYAFSLYFTYKFYTSVYA